MARKGHIAQDHLVQVRRLKDQVKPGTFEKMEGNVWEHIGAEKMRDFTSLPNHQLCASGGDLRKVTASNAAQCRNRCALEHACNGVNFHEETKQCFMKKECVPSGFSSYRKTR